MGGFLFQSRLCAFSALVLQSTVVLLLLTQSNEVDSQGVGPSQTITALVGEDVVLPCHLEPAVDATSESVEWARHDLEPRFVHVWHDSLDLLENQNPSYKGRTSLSADNLKRGDLSLKLSAVKLSDNGVYTCFFPSQYKEFTVQLVVGSFSSPVINGIYRGSDGLDLQCESKGWYPEPEVSWLDGEGNIISTAQTKTVRGPDDLFTVSSRVTVEKTNGNIFTCRVQQKDINQTRETSIYVSADIFEASSSAAVRVSIMAVILLGFVAVAAFVFWKFIFKAKKHQDAEMEQRELLMIEEKKREDLEEKKKTLEEDLKKKEEEQRDLEEKVHKLTDQCKELKNQADQLKHHREDMERTSKDIEEKFKSAETIAERDKAEGYLEMKAVALTTQNIYIYKKHTSAVYG
ncbi:butyrophilin-like protein 10 [Cheilinus undulatus]|uniref:butyrophilin-like protein 10 n=1 Tax=Cheilinus undulatus TaxID=241271 RepID=UPI001BD69BC3|nr:butyrophilin-like protein 10 [Cheilinus undulatus]